MIRWKALKSNRLPTRWAFKRWRLLFIMGVLPRKEAIAAVFIAGVYQLFHLNSFQAVQPPIECYTIQLWPRMVSGPWRVCIKLGPFTCFAHGLDITYNTMCGSTSDDRYAGQLEEVPGYTRLARSRDVEELVHALIGWFDRCMAILDKAAFMIPPFTT